MATVGDAIALAARGFRVFPLRENDWRPKITGWVDAATTSEETIRRWWTQWPAANVGVATGQGLLVIDIDNKKGKNGSESFAALALPPEALDTFTVETPSGGRHVYFRVERDHPNSAGRLGDGLDTRGAGGYVVGPGSTLTEGAKDGQAGGVYGVGNNHQVRPAPGALAGRFVESTGFGWPSADGHERAGLAALQAAERYAREARPAIQGVGGDHTTFVVVAQLRDLGADEEDAFDLLVDHWNDRCEPPWELEDLRTKVANAYRYGENPPGLKSPAVQFNGVHVPAIEAPVRAPSKFYRFGQDLNPPRDEWLFFEVLPKIGTAVLVGETQSGKTFLELEIARCGATGKALFKIPPDERFGSIFVFAGTEGSGLHKRVLALQETGPLPISATVVGDLNRTGALKELLEDLKGEAAYIEVMFGVKVRMVFIETLAASGLLPRENDAGDASRAVHNMANITNAMQVLTMTSHHPAKGTNESRGSGAVTGAVDCVLAIRRNGKDKVRQVELVKARDAEQRTLGSFSLLPVILGKDSKGRDITSMTVSMGEPETPASRMTKHAPLLVEVIEWAGIESGRTIDGRVCVPKDTVWTIFQERCKTPTDKSNQHKVYRQALEYLESQGVIEYVDHGKETFIHRRELFA